MSITRMDGTPVATREGRRGRNVHVQAPPLVGGVIDVLSSSCQEVRNPPNAADPNASSTTAMPSRHPGDSRSSQPPVPSKMTAANSSGHLDKPQPGVTAQSTPDALPGWPPRTTSQERHCRTRAAPGT